MPGGVQEKTAGSVAGGLARLSRQPQLSTDGPVMDPRSNDRPYVATKSPDDDIARE